MQAALNILTTTEELLRRQIQMMSRGGELSSDGWWTGAELLEEVGMYNPNDTETEKGRKKME